MGFESEIKSGVTQGGKSFGGSLGTFVHDGVAKVDSTAIRHAKYKARFKSTLSGTDKAKYDSICDTEKELFGIDNKFLSPIKFITLKARLSKEREGLRKNLTEDQKIQFTKVNQLAAAVLKEEARYRKFGSKVGKLAAGYVNKKY